jgi:hypothetical protein
MIYAINGVLGRRVDREIGKCRYRARPTVDLCALGRCLCQRFPSQVLRIPPSVGAGSLDMPRLRSIQVSYVEALESRKLEFVPRTSRTRTQPRAISGWRFGAPKEKISVDLQIPYVQYRIRTQYQTSLKNSLKNFARPEFLCQEGYLRKCQCFFCTPVANIYASPGLRVEYRTGVNHHTAQRSKRKW